jgi:hypothetical protein
MSTDLAAFLHARITEDEQVAKAASDGRWYVEQREETVLTDNTRADILTAGAASALSMFVVYDEAFGGCSTVDATHIARHHPARVLVDCAAKHAIVKWATANPLLCGDIHPGADIYHFDGHDHPVLLALAQPWADHPDYHPDWQT